MYNNTVSIFIYQIRQQSDNILKICPVLEKQGKVSNLLAPRTFIQTCGVTSAEPFFEINENQLGIYRDLRKIGLDDSTQASKL